MKIVVTTFLDQLYELLRQGPHLVTLYDQKDSSFITTFRSWLEESEVVLENYHRPQLSEIAGVRAQLLSASNGVIDKGLSHIPSTGRRRILHANAAILFNKAQGILNDVYHTFSAHKEEGEKYMRQIILISLQKNSFYPVWNSNFDEPEKLTMLWQSFVADNDLIQGVRQVLSSVHYLDALRIMDEVIIELKL